jgi:hypothetical protein
MPEEQDDRLYLGVFADQDDVLRATRACREADFTFEDVYAPYAVHGLDRAMGLPFSKITWVTFLCGALGGLFAFGGMAYIAWWDWPMNIGGKPSLPVPAMIPITFEVTVLVGGLCTMLALFLFCRLYPGKRARLMHPRVTDDRFVIALVQDEDFDPVRAREIFEKNNVEEIKDVDAEYNALDEIEGQKGAA